MFTVSKSFVFDAAHRLYQLPETHKCHNLHGHTWKVDITIESTSIDEKTGFVVDFGELKFIKEWIDEYLDHGVLIAKNDTTLFDVCRNILNCKFYWFDELPVVSAETLAFFFARKFKETIKGKLESKGLKLHKLAITVWETAQNKATYYIVLG